VESGLYPFVQVYFRTFDQNMQPLINLNERNLGVMVKGRSYDPAKRQYVVQNIRNREEAVRTVFVIDCSKTMAGKPFQAALEAAARFIDGKRKQDQVAIIAVTDAERGYEEVSVFERDPAALGRRLADLEPDGNTTRLYDAIGAAMQMCAMAGPGGVGTSDAEYIISNSIVVFSDGKDENSALTRTDLMTRITSLPVPVPIYSLAYSKIDPQYLANLEALSKNSFGAYFPISETLDNMTRSVEAIQNILQNDYVVVFRAYQEVDGDTHPLKIGVEYPSNSGRMIYQSADFEAIEPPPVQQILDAQGQFAAGIPALPDGNPYLTNPHIQQVPAEVGP
jgi:Mg-chelatase subunit ChlD